MTGPTNTPTLEDILPGIEIDQAGGACPFQAEGRIAGHPFYYRERGGNASLQVALWPITGDEETDEAIERSLWDDCWSAAVRVPEFRETGEDGEGPWMDTLVNLAARLRHDERPVWAVRTVDARMDHNTLEVWPDERLEAFADDPAAMARLLASDSPRRVHARSAEEAIEHVRTTGRTLTSWLPGWGWPQHRVELANRIETASPMVAELEREGNRTGPCPVVVRTHAMATRVWGPTANWLVTPFAADAATDEREWRDDAWICRHHDLLEAVRRTHRENQRAELLSVGGERGWDELSRDEDPWGTQALVRTATELAAQSGATPLLSGRSLERQLDTLSWTLVRGEQRHDEYQMAELMLCLLGDTRPADEVG